jgi:hypothetical protein
MDDDRRDDEFWNLVAAYIDASDHEALQRESSRTMFEQVERHVNSCSLCRARRRIVLAQRTDRGPKAD